jgi:hypothetical protein
VAIRVATQDGNWSDTATWGGSAAPGDGDSAHIPSGIDVTVDANTTVGLGAALSAPQSSSDNITSCSATAGGSLPDGSYFFFYTNVDGSGNESGPSGEMTVTLGGGNNTITYTVPALPGGISSRNIYLSDTGGTTFSGRLYKTGETGTSGNTLSSASWTDGTTTYANAARPPVAIAVFGALAIGAGFSLTVKGDVVMVDAPVTGGAGSSFIGNVPASTVYRVLVGTDSGQASAKITLTGTSGSKFTVDRTGTGTWMWTAAMRGHSGGTQANGHGGYALTHCNVTDMGSASVNAIEFNDFGGHEFSLTNCVVSNCGQIYFVNSPDTTSVLRFVDSTIRGALGTYGLSYEVSGTTPSGGGARVMTGCVFDCAVRFSMNGFTVEDNLFFGTRNHQGGTSASFDGNLVVFTTNASELVLNADLSNNWLLAWNGGASINNVHWVDPSGSGLTIECAGNVWECPTGTGGGDCMYIGSGQATVNAHNNIGLPDLTGVYETGFLLNMAKNGSSTNTGQCNHNTWFAGIQAMMGTESAQYAGMFTSCKSNYVEANNTGYIVSGGAGTEVQDTLAAANATHNGKFEVAAGSEGGGYDYDMSGSPGANDVAEDPAFSGGWPSVKAWGASLGLTGTDTEIIDDTLAALKLRNDPSWDSDFSVANYVAYVRAAVRPTNENYRAAGHDGEDIGAVAMAYNPALHPFPQAFAPNPTTWQAVDY